MGAWWQSPDSVRYINDWLQSIAVWFTAIAALAGIASLITTRRLGELEPPQTVLVARVTSAEAAAVAAEKKAETADKNVAAAQERAAAAEAARLQAAEEQAARERQLRQELDEARADAEKIKSALAPRHLSDDQRQKFLAFLPRQKDKGPMVVLAPMSDPEAIAFSDELAALLQQAGWNVAQRMAQFMSPPKGLIVVTNDVKDPSPYWLQKGLEHIGLDASGRAPKEKQSDPVQLIVGHKH